MTGGDSRDKGFIAPRQRILFPCLFLNLGRAYLKGNRKAEAVDAFHEGLINYAEIMICYGS